MPDIEDEQRTVWQRLSLKQLCWTALAVILVATAAFGGLQTAHHVTAISLGQTYNAGALRVTSHSVSLTDHRDGLPRLSPECRFLVLNATIQNTANESVPFPLSGALGGGPGDCAPQKPRNNELFAITGNAGRYAAAFRGHEGIDVPSIDSGFTNDYSVVWAVSTAELRRHPDVTIRIYKMSTYVSTFIIAHRWAGDADHYAELRIPTSELP